MTLTRFLSFRLFNAPQRYVRVPTICSENLSQFLCLFPFACYFPLLRAWLWRRRHA